MATVRFATAASAILTDSTRAICVITVPPTPAINVDPSEARPRLRAMRRDTIVTSAPVSNARFAVTELLKVTATITLAPLISTGMPIRERDDGSPGGEASRAFGNDMATGTGLK